MSLSRNNDKTHFFTANAVALGGRITRPFNELLEVQAATALPIGGGHGRAHVENFRFKQIASFRSAQAQVAGSESADKDSYATLAAVTIEGLSVLDVVTARAIVSRISSNYPAPARTPGQPPSQEPSIVPV